MHLGTDFVHVGCLYIDNEFNQRQNNYGGKSPETYMESADMEEQKYAYRGNDIPTSDFIIALSEPGDYCIEINAKAFRGSYVFQIARKHNR